MASQANERLFRVLVGSGIGAIAGALFGALIAGLVAIFSAENAGRIGFLSFVGIFAIAGAVSGLIQWWASAE